MIILQRYSRFFTRCRSRHSCDHEQEDKIVPAHYVAHTREERIHVM